MNTEKQLRKALELAADFIEDVHDGEWLGSDDRRYSVQASIRDALSQPPEPQQRDTHHWPQQGDQSWPPAPEQQAPGGASAADCAKDAIATQQRKYEEVRSEQQAPQGEWVCVAPPCKCDSSNFNRCCFSSTAAPEAATGGMNFHDVLAADLGVIQREPEAAKTEPVGINGLTEVETSATASVMGLVKPETERADIDEQQIREAGRVVASQNGHEYPGESADAYLAGFKACAALLSADRKAWRESVEALKKIKVRLHFMGWPAEPMWNVGTEESPRWIPDWRYEIALIENVLNGSPITAPEKPTDTIPAYSIAATLLAADSKAGGESDAPAGSGGWKPHAEQMESERDYWRARAQAMHEHQRGECWYWQGDGEDHLESMAHTLPIVIRAEQLRELLARPQQQAKPLTKQQITACASNLADTILFDLQDRKGLLDGVDEDTLQEIVAAHTSIIIDGLAVHGIGRIKHEH